MRYFAAAIAMVLALYLGVGAMVDYQAFQSGEASRVTRSFSDEHDRAQVHIDELAVRDEELRIEIDHEQHRKNDGSALKRAKIAEAADRGLVALDEDRLRWEPPVPSVEMMGLRGFAGVVMLIVSVLILSVARPKSVTEASEIPAENVSEGLSP